MTGYEVLYEDAALARSLQLVADLDFAERECARKHRRKVAIRLRRNASESSEDSVLRLRDSFDDYDDLLKPGRNDARRVPDPPAAGERTRVGRSNENDIVRSSRAPRRSKSNRRSRHPERRARSKPSLAQAMLCDGSRDEDKNKSLVYVPCEVNDRVVPLMVDTGAQTSVISTPLMEKLCLDKKLNRDRQGVAAGVGTARIIGRIENCPVQIGHAEFRLYFAVLDIDQDMLILGIDQMRRFNCLLDLQNNQLIFGGRGGVEVDFFTEDS